MAHGDAAFGRGGGLGPARRRRLGRAGSVAAAVVLLLALLLGVRASSAVAENQPPIKLAAAPWQRIPLPAPDGRAVHTYAPSPSDPNTVYACVGPVLGSADPSPIGPIWLFLTHDEGAHWDMVPTPAPAGSWCDVQVSPTVSGRITLEVSVGMHYDEGMPLCAETTSFRSDHSGATWRELPPLPLGLAPPASASCVFWMAGSARFAEIVYHDSRPPAPVSRRHTALMRSDDGGVTWQRADLGLPEDGYIWRFLLGGPYASVYRSAERMVATVLRYSGASTKLAPVWETWGTVDGRSWQQLSSMSLPAMMDSPPVAASHPLYLVLGDQIPAFDFYTSIHELGDNYQPVGSVPPLPVPNAAPDRTGILQVLGAVPDGRLIALGVSADRGLWPIPPPANARLNQHDYLGTSWVWIWDPQSERWTVVLAPLAAEPGRIPYGCGNCWDAHLTGGMGQDVRGRPTQGTYVWLRDWFGTQSIAYRRFVADSTG